MRITLPTGTPAELARPDGDIEPSLGVVLFPDVMGLRPLFDEMCARLAAEHAWVVRTSLELLRLAPRLGAVGLSASESLEVLDRHVKPLAEASRSGSSLYLFDVRAARALLAARAVRREAGARAPSLSPGATPTTPASLSPTDSESLAPVCESARRSSQRPTTWRAHRGMA